MQGNFGARCGYGAGSGSAGQAERGPVLEALQVGFDAIRNRLAEAAEQARQRGVSAIKI